MRAFHWPVPSSSLARMLKSPAFVAIRHSFSSNAASVSYSSKRGAPDETLEVPVAVNAATLVAPVAVRALVVVVPVNVGDANGAAPKFVRDVAALATSDRLFAASKPPPDAAGLAHAPSPRRNVVASAVPVAVTSPGTAMLSFGANVPRSPG